MKEHKYRLLVAAENQDYGGIDLYYWCEGCGTVKMKPGRVDKETLFYIPLGDSVLPNSHECFENVCDKGMQ
jgi:hypothetical protein